MVLRRITEKVEYRSLGHIRLWLDDLQAIIASVREVSPHIEMVVNGDYQIDRIDDLTSLDPPSVRSFVLRMKVSEANLKPDAILELSRTNALLTLTNPRRETLGMATYIERRAKDRKRPVYSIRGALSIFTMLAACVALFALAIDSNFKGRLEVSGSPSDLLVASVISLAILAVTILGVYSLMNRTLRRSSAVIIPKSKEEAPPWLQRNRDALVTNTIVSAVFLTVGIVVGYLLPKS